MKFAAPLMVAIATMAVIVTGCASFGEEFDLAAVDQLQPGISTIEDAKRLLGEPQSVAKTANGITVYVWLHSKANGLTGNSSAQSASLAFGPDGKMLKNSTKTSVAGS
jgi:hypothetical protein